jgi:chromosome segregation ATPase
MSKPVVPLASQSKTDLVGQLRSMQQMEKETQETLAKFMSAMQSRNETDYASMLEDKVSELHLAESENLRLRNEMDKYEDRIEQLQKNEEIIMKEKGQIMDEKLRAGKAATQADQIIKNIQSQMRALEQKHSQDLDIKVSMLRNLEEENVRSKVHCEEAQARLESFTHETAELHSAMASLHGEIAAQQRELDEGKERDARHARQKKEVQIRLEEKETELGRLKAERRNLDARCTDLEKKLNEALAKDDLTQQEGKTQVDALVRERDNVSGSLAKMSHKLRQQTETSKELNAAMNRMRLELSNALDSSARECARADAAVRDVQSLQIIVSSLERSKTEADALVQRMEQEKLGLNSDLTQVNERNTALLAEQRKLTANVDRLERQRTEVTVELSCRTKEFEGLKKNYDNSQIELEENRARIDTERLGKERALERIGILENGLERDRNEMREQTENIEAQARQLRESERMREQALETSRTQQRENANRIIEFSQKNAKLASELSAKDDELSSLRRNREDIQSRGVESTKERDDAKNQYLATRVRLQALEDEHEMSIAKFEASKAENEQLRNQLKQEIKHRESTIGEMLEKHDEAITMLQQRLESESEEKVHIIEAAHKQAEERLTRAVAKEKETHKQHLAEFDAQRQEDSEVQRSRLATLAHAMEGLQAELREESSKNSNLSQELSVLKDLAEVGNTEMQERVNYVERERARERNRLEGQLTDVKEQMRQAVEQKQQRDQLMATIEQQLTREREAKFQAMQRVRVAEDETSSLTNQVDTLAEENASHKKDIRSFERKLAVAIQSKDAEIVRLTRRNEVLGEAVTRLTTQQGSGGSSTSKSIGKFFTSGISQISSPGEDLGKNADVDNFAILSPEIKSPIRRQSAANILAVIPSEVISQRAVTAPQAVSSSINEILPLPPSPEEVENTVTFKATDSVSDGFDLTKLIQEAVETSIKEISSDGDVDVGIDIDEDVEVEVVTTPLGSTSGSNIINSDDSGESGRTKFKERLELTVEQGKDLQLAFSPKRVSSAPIARVSTIEIEGKGKENITVTQQIKKTQNTSIPKPATERMKRASEYLKKRQSNSATVSRKPAVF